MKPIERTLVILTTEDGLLAACRQTTETSRQILLDEATQAIGNEPERLLLIGPTGLEDDFIPEEVNKALNPGGDSTMARILSARHNPKYDVDFETLLSRIHSGYYGNENGTAQFKFEVLNHWPDPANEPVFSDLMKQHADLPPKDRLEEVLGDFVKVCK